MEKIIATIVIIVLTLGLISYAIIGQVGGFKDTADRVTEEQTKLNLLLNDASLVTRKTVEYYIKNADSLDVEVTISGKTGPAQLSYLEGIGDSALFRMAKVYGSTGTLKEISFTLED